MVKVQKVSPLSLFSTLELWTLELGRTSEIISFHTLKLHTTTLRARWGRLDDSPMATQLTTDKTNTEHKPVLHVTHFVDLSMTASFSPATQLNLLLLLMCSKEKDAHLGNLIR